MNDPNDALSKDNLLRRMELGWNELQAYLATLSEAQLTQPTDAAGWTAKDHIIHMAMWEKSALALLEGRSQRDGMEIDQATWSKGDDAINAVMQQRYRDLPLDEVKRIFQQVHDSLLAKVHAMTEEALLLPYRHYQQDSDEDRPVIWSVIGNTMMHYGDHQPWIAAIVAKHTD